MGSLSIVFLTLSIIILLEALIILTSPKTIAKTLRSLSKPKALKKIALWEFITGLILLLITILIWNL